MKLKKLILPVLLIAALVCVLPLGVSAETYGDFTYSVSGDTVTITKYNGSASTVEVPAEIDGKPVTAIGNRAFYNNDDLQKVIIPTSVQSIGDSAFEDCWYLSTVTLPDGLKTIGNRAFADSGNLVTIKLPDSVTSIGTECFENGTRLQNVTLSKNLKVIPEDAFSECEYINSISFPEGLTTIGKGAFYRCALTEVKLPDTVTSIGENAFGWNTELTSVELSSGLTSIPSNAFYFAREMTTLVIPEGVTSIGERAFGNCYELATLTLPKSIKTIGKQAFWEAEFTAVHYQSTMSDWAAVSVGADNGDLNEKLLHAWDASGNTCTVCGYSCTHSGGLASCLGAPVCDICGHRYGVGAPDNHLSTETYFAKTSEMEHTEYRSCCNEGIAVSDHSVGQEGDLVANCIASAYCHVCQSHYGERNEDNHTSTVTYFENIGETRHAEFRGCCHDLVALSEHSVGQEGDLVAVCNAGAYCHVCGNHYGEKDPANHTSTEILYKTDNRIYHTPYRACCRETLSTELHTIENGKCTICNRHFNVTVSHGVSVSGYDNVKDALNEAQALSKCRVTLHSYSEGSSSGYTVSWGDITIDLNGCSLTSSNANVITVNSGAKLTITDSSSGAGYIKSSNGYALMIDGGEVHVQGGHLQEEYTDAIYSAYLDNGKLYLEGGTIDGIFVNQASSELYISGDAPGNSRTCWINFQVRDVVDWLPRVQITQALTGDDTYTFRNESVGNVVAGGLNYTLTEADAARFAYQDNSLVVTLNETDNTLFMMGDVAGAAVTLDPAEFTYDGTAKTPAVTVKHHANSLTEGTDYTVSYSNNINAGTATVTVTGMGNFVGTKEVTFPINKATAPAITFPTVLNEITYGQRMKDFALSFYENDYGTFNWADPTGVPNAGNGNYALDFYPSELALQNYDWVDANGAQWIASRNALCIAPAVVVNKADLTITAPQPNDLTYTGEPLTLAQEGRWENRIFSGFFLYSTEQDGTYDATVPVVTNAGTYTLWYKPDNASADNYNDVGPWSLEVTVNKAIPAYTAPVGLEATPEQTLADVTLPAGFAWVDATASVGAAGAQSHKAVFTPEDTDNYEEVSLELTVAVLPDLSNLEDVTEENVTADQKEELEELLETVDELLALEDLAEETRTELEAARDQLEDLVTGLPPYKITAGDGSTWIKGSGRDLNFTANGHFTRFTGVKVDGKAVDAANYAASAGSTNVSLKASYLETLSRGEHTIEICYADGTASGTFKITRTGGAPGTGDTAQPMLYIALLAVSAAAMWLLMLKRKRA